MMSWIISGEAKTKPSACSPWKHNRATFNYDAFLEEKKRRDISCGVMVLQVEKSPKLRIVGAKWKASDEENFCDYEIQPYSRTVPSPTLTRLKQKEASRVAAALELTPERRLELLKNSPETPRKIAVTTYVYDRNPVVVAEALSRAAGICQRCACEAPFKSKSTGRPYLEVHHTQPLSEDGKDTLDNVEALCPNCHSKAHHGPGASTNGVD